jgi:hypothetical protein
MEPNNYINMINKLKKKSTSKISTMTENEVQSIDPINWIEEAINKEYFKYYDHQYFNNVKKIGYGSFGKVLRANWKKSGQYFALKSFFIFNDTTAKEIISEVFNFLTFFQSIINMYLF